MLHLELGDAFIGCNTIELNEDFRIFSEIMELFPGFNECDLCYIVDIFMINDNFTYMPIALNALV